MNEETSTKILEKLKELKKEEGKLPLLLEFYQKLLQAQSAVRKSITGPGAIPGSEEIQARLAEGKPLITFDEFIIDWGLLKKFFVEVIGVFSGYPELFGELPDSLKQPEAETLLTEEAVKNWFTGNALSAALTADISPTLLQTIVQSAVYPFLTKHGQALKDVIKKEIKDAWRREYCPFCGGSPDMAYLEPEMGARYLVCSRCDSAWSYQRLQCPYCLTQDQKALSFFMDESGYYRLQVCDNCKSYLKTLDMRKASGEVLIPLERVFTVEMDRQAREKGY